MLLRHDYATATSLFRYLRLYVCFMLTIRLLYASVGAFCHMRFTPRYAAMLLPLRLPFRYHFIFHFIASLTYAFIAATLMPPPLRATP